MDDNDRQAIEGLFSRLGEVARRAPPRDPEAEAFIARELGRMPGAPYFMAQTIVVQEAALEAAQARIAELEGQEAERPAGGGLFGGLFGDDRDARAAGGMPRVPRRRGPAGALGGGLGAAPGGGGFLAGAAQTAVGVAGGVLLGNALAGMFGAGAAEAAPLPEEEEEEAGGEPGADFDEGGFDDLDF
jgi:hypothetical protein